MKRERENLKKENDFKKYKWIDYKWMDEEQLEEALLNACEEGDIDSVKTLLENDENYVDLNFVKNDSVLHRAAVNGHVDVMKVLIQNDADVNAVDEEEETALHWAAEGIFCVFCDI